MTRIASILATSLCIIMQGCSVLRHAECAPCAVHDSVRVETRTVERIDTAYVDVPRIVERTVTRDTVSLIKNEYAVSMARVMHDGLLMHTLETTGRRIPVEVVTKEVKRDSIVTKEVPVYIDKVVEVEKPMKRIVRLQVIGFWAALCIMFFKCRKVLWKAGKWFMQRM